MSRNCPLCRGSELRRFSPVAFDAQPGTKLNVLECEVCGAAWQWPRRRDALQSVGFFDSSYSEQNAGSYFDPERRKIIADMELDWLESLRPGRGALLDIGAGDGTLIKRAAARDWFATGIEPSGEATRAFNPENTNAQLLQSTIETFGASRCLRRSHFA